MWGGVVFVYDLENAAAATSFLGWLGLGFWFGVRDFEGWLAWTLFGALWVSSMFYDVTRQGIG